MTLSEAISSADKIRPDSSFGQSIKAALISSLDMIISREILKDTEFSGYCESDTERTLIVPEPYCSIYPQYIIMKISEARGDWQSYNAYSALFDSSYTRFADWYNRERRYRR